MIDFLLILWIILLLVLSAFFSGVETGIYRLSRFTLRIGVEQRRPFFRELQRAIEDGQGLILSLLIGNNLVNYGLTTTVTILLLKKFNSTHLAEFYTTVIITPTIFILGELIPKNIFFYRANSLVGGLAPLICFFWRLFTLSGAIGFLRILFRLFSRLLGLSVDTAAAVDVTQRGQVRAIIQETRDEGLLSSLQKEMMHRLINIPEVPAADIMVPLYQVEMAEVRSTRNALIEIIRRCPHRHIPVYEKDRTTVLGFIDIYETLGTGGDFQTIRPFVRPIVRLRASASALDAIALLRTTAQRIALIVVDTPGKWLDQKKPLGILTLKDMVEELTGELAGTEAKTKIETS
jgi:CBS domain containing-hemolysin-like protein